MCGWLLNDLGMVVLHDLKLVHKPIYDVKEYTNWSTVGISALALDWYPGLNRRRVSETALQGERAILKDLFCGHGVQLQTQFVTAWKFGFEELFQELPLVSLERAERGIHDVSLLLFFRFVDKTARSPGFNPCFTVRRK